MLSKTVPRAPEVFKGRDLSQQTANPERPETGTDNT